MPRSGLPPIAPSYRAQNSSFAVIMLRLMLALPSHLGAK